MLYIYKTFKYAFLTQITKMEININVDDVNDNAPVFAKSTYYINVIEEETRNNILHVTVKNAYISIVMLY